MVSTLTSADIVFPTQYKENFHIKFTTNVSARSVDTLQ